MNDLTTINNHALTVSEGSLDQNPAAVYLAGLAPRSRRTMGDGLTIIARIVTGDDDADYLSIPWHGLRFQHTAAIRSQLAERYAYSTANRILSAMRGVLRAAWKLGMMGADDFHTAASVANVKGETIPAGRHVPLGEVTALLNGCDQTMGGIRDAAIISLLYAGGLRRAELVALDLVDYDQAAGSLKVKGKGSKTRLVPVVNGAASALADWLAVRGDAPGALFTGTGNRQRGGRLTTQAIYNLLTARAAAAGIAKLSPHDFRRSFVGELLERGADISTVQKLAGHANVTTTQRYDRRGEAVKRRAAELLHVPYTPRTLSGAA
jgi:site-specific recombinase XerD